jgi:hypothetical protein
MRRWLRDLRHSPALSASRHKRAINQEIAQLEQVVMKAVF